MAFTKLYILFIKLDLRKMTSWQSHLSAKTPLWNNALVQDKLLRNIIGHRLRAGRDQLEGFFGNLGSNMTSG